MLTTLRCLTALACIALADAVMGLTIAEASQPQSHAARAEHAVAGEVKRVDLAAKILVMRTADGAEETVKFIEGTTVRGVKDVARVTEAAAKAALEGGAVVLHYTGEGAAKTAVLVDHIGKRTVKIAKGTVMRIGEAGRFVVLKTASGAEETFDLARDVVVETGRGVEAGVHATGAALKQGAEVTVHYSEEGGKKIVHVVRRF
ncbi:MAG: hypothetical protein ACRD3C_07570 [Vicinamibacterales bacterium]